MFQWMQNLGAKMGEPLPQALFLPPRPPEDTPVSTSIPSADQSLAMGVKFLNMENGGGSRPAL